MTRLSRVLSWLAQSPMWWRVAAIFITLLLTLLVVLGPLPPLIGAAVLAAILIASGLLIATLVDRTALELCFLGFVALMPATRFSLFEASFSIQANFVVILLVAGLLIWRAGMRGLPLRLLRSRVHLPIIVLFGIVALSFFLSAQVPPGQYRGEVRYVRSAKQIANLALMVVTYVTVLLTVQDRRLFRWAIWTFIGSSFVVSLYGLYQFVAYPLGLPFVDLFPQSASFGPSVQYTMTFAGARFLRIWSVASEPTWFGDYLTGVIPLAGVLTLAGLGPRRGRRFFMPIASATMFIAVLLTFTRSAYMALVVGILTLVAFRPKLLVYGLILITIVVIVVAVLSLVVAQVLPSVDQASLVNAIVSRVTSPLEEAHFGNIHRTTAIVTSWEMFRHRPWGVGYGNYGFFFYQYRPIWGSSMTDAHPEAFPVMSGGILLRFLTETSIPGFLAFLWLVVTVIWEALNIRKHFIQDRFMETVMVGLLAGFVSLMARLALFGDSIHFTYQWFIIAMIVVARRVARRGTASITSDEVA